MGDKATRCGAPGMVARSCMKAMSFGATQRRTSAGTGIMQGLGAEQRRVPACGIRAVACPHRCRMREACLRACMRRHCASPHMAQCDTCMEYRDNSGRHDWGMPRLQAQRFAHHGGVRPPACDRQSDVQVVPVDFGGRPHPSPIAFNSNHGVGEQRAERLGAKRRLCDALMRHLHKTRAPASPHASFALAHALPHALPCLDGTVNDREHPHTSAPLRGAARAWRHGRLLHLLLERESEATGSTASEAAAPTHAFRVPPLAHRRPPPVLHGAGGKR